MERGQSLDVLVVGAPLAPVALGIRGGAGVFARAQAQGHAQDHGQGLRQKPGWPLW